MANKNRTQQAFWLGIGNIVSFSFGIVSAAILSRYLTKGDYGTYRQVLYVYSTLLVVFSLGLPRAYSFFLPRLPLNEGQKSINKINRVFLCLGAIFSCILFFGSKLISILLNNPELDTCLRCFSLTPIFLLPVLGLESIMATYKSTEYATIYIICSRFFTLACVVLPVALFSYGANEAAIGFTVASAICCFIGIKIERLPFKNTEPAESSLSIKDVLKYAFPLLVASIWGIIINSAPQFFISRWFGSTEFAEFANGFIELPFAGMVIGAISTILLPEISRLATNPSNLNQVISIWKSSYKKAAIIIYPLAIFACIFASEIIILLYGDKYNGSVFYFKLIVIINLLRVVPYAPVMMGLNMGKKYAIANIVPAILVLIGDSLLVIFWHNVHYIAIMQCIIISLHIAIMLFFISNKIGISLNKIIPLKFSFRLLVVSFLCCLCSREIVSYLLIDASNIFKLLMGGSLFMIFFLIISKFIGFSYWELIKPIIKK